MSNRIRISKHIWNTYEPPPSQNSNTDATRGPTSPIRLRLNLPPTPQNPASPEVEEEPCTGTRCKVKLARFNYGGPQRQQKGQWQNQITFEQPCLHPTCPNCLEWHADLMRELTPEDDAEEGCGGVREQEEGMSSEVDPRFLDNPPLVEQATPNALGEKRWRSTPRESYTVRLFFRSDMGRIMYRRMFGMWDSSEKKRRYGRVRRARVEDSNNTGGVRRHRHERNGDVFGGHHVKLVFMTKQGRAAFAELVRGVSR
ncbi:hypothetical protein P3342_006228 [Pyrenophora teres f. teres]|nr:hypothetical protein P3342_006228 [Pyrenophora teres f. teres]